MIKTRIKEWIVKLPLMRGFMMKWVKARQDIEALQMQSLLQEKKINSMPELIHQGELCCDLQNVRMMQFERNMAYDRMLANKSGMTKQELSLAIDVQYLSKTRPFVSIIILNRNGRKHLEVLMTSFHRHRFYDNFEIIAVDNASTDDSVSYLESWSSEYKIHIIRNSENMSFSAANNLGAKSAAGEFLVFLNNDTEVTDGWLDELLIAAHRACEPGAIGAKLIYPRIPEDSVNSGKSYCIQHMGIAFRDIMLENGHFIQPYNKGNGQEDLAWEAGIEECAAVTAAVLFVSKDAFDKVGGFDENYDYGYEDVDFCLKLVKSGFRNYCCKSCLVFHYEFGTQREDDVKKIRNRRLNNRDVLKGKWQSWLSRRILDEKLDHKHSIFTEKKLIIALVVTEADPSTAAGDYFTAMEFAGSLEKAGYEIKYLSRRGKMDWYDVGVETDVLISLLDAYDVGKIYHYKNDLVKIAWARNWFERWCEREYFDLFDIVLASSMSACRYVNEHSCHTAILFPIAASERFFDSDREFLSKEESGKYRSDYAFTGNYWGVKRDLMECLNPKELPYTFKIYGNCWDQVEQFKDYTCGHVPYTDMKKIYMNTKIIIDDAVQGATKTFGSVNCRVYDALAAGTLVITSGTKGAEETFGGILPSFKDKEELMQRLRYYLENEKERGDLVQKLQKIVLENHTYDIRAKKLVQILKDFNLDHVDSDTIDICGAMPEGESLLNWGDYHFAQAMKKEFCKIGFHANVVPINHWYDKSRAKYIIALRGTKPYYPSMNDRRKYIMWNISHPQDVATTEYNLFDFVFFASQKMLDEIGPQIQADSSLLLQCADPETMSYTNQSGGKRYELLFVGNSRGIYRPILRDLLPTKYKLSVYGQGWGNMPVKNYVVSDYLENDKLGQAYHNAEIVLNDHWDDMRKYGIISNRIFDALAAGAFVISDYVSEIEQIFHGNVVCYCDREDLKSKIRYYLKNKKEREHLAQQGQEIVLTSHTFSIRIHEMCSILKHIE